MVWKLNGGYIFPVLIQFRPNLARLISREDFRLGVS